MVDLPKEIELRRCQKCGQVEKVETGEIVVTGKHSDACGNPVEVWERFTAPPNWPSGSSIDL